MKQQERGGWGSKYMRNLHIIGRTHYAHTHKKEKETNKKKRPNLPLNMEACFSILEVIAHPEGVKSINST